MLLTQQGRERLAVSRAGSFGRPPECHRSGPGSRRLRKRKIGSGDVLWGARTSPLEGPSGDE